MNFFAFSSAINATTAIVLGCIVLYKKPDRRQNQTFFLFCFAIFCWGVCHFFGQTATDYARAFGWIKALMFFVIIIPVFFYHYTIAFLNRRDQKWILFASYVVCVGLALSNFGHFIVSGIRPKSGFPYWGIAGPLFYMHMATFSGLLFYSLYLMMQEAKVAKGLQKWQVQCSIWATILGFGGGMTNYFLWLDIPIKPYGNILVSAYTGLLAYAILKYRLMDINIFIRKTMIYSSVTGILTLVYLLVIAVFTKVFQGLARFGTVFSPALAACLITVFFQPLRKRVQAFVDAKFFRQYVDREEKLYELSREVITHTTPEAMGEALMRVLEESFHPKVAALYLRSRNGAGFSSMGVLGAHRLELMAEDNPLSRYFADHHQPFVQDEASELGEPQSTRVASKPRNRNPKEAA